MDGRLGHVYLFLSFLATVSNTPYFRGDSYIVVPYLLSDSNYTLLDISLQTQSNNGLVLFASNKDQSNYFSLGLESSLLTLRLKQGQTLVNLDARYHPIADGRWHSVSIFQEGSHLVLEVDGYHNSTQIIVSGLNLQSHTYLGGVNNFTILPNGISQSSGFIGLLNITVQIGGTNVHIINDSIAGVNVGDGVPALCTPDSCSNGGICQEDSVKYSCLCPLGFGGVYCAEGESYIDKKNILTTYCIFRSRYTSTSFFQYLISYCTRGQLF